MTNRIFLRNVWVAYTMFNYHLLHGHAMGILHASFLECGRHLFSLKNFLGDAFMEENDCNDVLNLLKMVLYTMHRESMQNLKIGQKDVYSWDMPMTMVKAFIRCLI